MTLLSQFILIFVVGLALLLIGQFALKAYKKWKLALTIIGALIMSAPLLFILYLIFLIISR